MWYPLFETKWVLLSYSQLHYMYFTISQTLNAILNPRVNWNTLAFWSDPIIIKCIHIHILRSNEWFEANFAIILDIRSLALHYSILNMKPTNPLQNIIDFLILFNSKRHSSVIYNCQICQHLVFTFKFQLQFIHSQFGHILWILWMEKPFSLVHRPLVFDRIDEFAGVRVCRLVVDGYFILIAHVCARHVTMKIIKIKKSLL